MLAVLGLLLTLALVTTCGADLDVSTGLNLERRSVQTPTLKFTFALGTDFRWPLVSSFGTLDLTIGGNTISMDADVVQVGTATHKFCASYIQIPYTTGTPFLFSSLYTLNCNLTSSTSLQHTGDYAPPLAPVSWPPKVPQIIPTGRYIIDSGFAGTCYGKMNVYGDAYPVSFSISDAGVTNMVITYSSAAEQISLGDPPVSLSATFKVSNLSAVPSLGDADLSFVFSTSQTSAGSAQGQLSWDATSGSFLFEGRAEDFVTEGLSLSGANATFTFKGNKDTLTWAGLINANVVGGNGFAQTAQITYQTGKEAVSSLGVHFEEFLFEFSGLLSYNPQCGFSSVGSSSFTLKPPSQSTTNSYYNTPSTTPNTAYDSLTVSSATATYDRCLQTLRLLTSTKSQQWSINGLSMAISALDVTGYYTPVTGASPSTHSIFKWPLIPGKHNWLAHIEGLVTAPWGVVSGTVSLITSVTDYPQLTIPYTHQNGGWNISLSVVYGSYGGNATGSISVDCHDSKSTLLFNVIGHYDQQSDKWSLTGTSQYEDVLLTVSNVYLSGPISATFTGSADSWAGTVTGFNWQKKLSSYPIIVETTKRSTEPGWGIRGEPVVLSINPFPQRIRVSEVNTAEVEKRSTPPTWSFNQDGISFSVSIPNVTCTNGSTTFEGEVEATLSGIPGQKGTLDITGSAEFEDCSAGFGGDFSITFHPNTNLVLSVGPLDFALANLGIVVKVEGAEFSLTLSATFGSWTASVIITHNGNKHLIQVGDSGVISIVEEGSTLKNPAVEIIFLLTTNQSYNLADLLTEILPGQGNCFAASAADAIVQPLSAITVKPYMEINLLEKYVHLAATVNLFNVEADFNAMLKLDSGIVVVLSFGLPSIDSVPGLGFIAKAGIDADFTLTLATADVETTPWEGAVGAGLTLAFDISIDFQIAGKKLSEILQNIHVPLPPNATITFYGNIASMTKMSFEVFLASDIGFSFLYLDKIGFSVFLDGNQAGVGLLVDGGFLISDQQPVGPQHCLVDTVVAIQGPPINLAFDVTATLDTTPDTWIIFPGFAIAFPVGFTAHIDITTGTPVPTALGFEGGLVLGFAPNQIQGYVKINIPVEQPQNLFLGLSIEGLTLYNFLDLIFNSPLLCPGGVNSHFASQKRDQMNFCATYQTPKDPWMDLFGLDKLGFCLNAGPNAISWGGSCTGDLTFNGTEVVPKMSAQGAITNLRFGPLRIPYAMIAVSVGFPDIGIQVQGTMDPISLGVLSITSATDPKQGPSVYLSLTKDISKIGFALNGQIKTPIFSVATNVNISKAGFFFFTSINICEIAGVSLSVNAPLPGSSTSIAAPTTPISIGCYADTSARDLSFVAQSGSSSMTPSACNTLCAGYTYFGIQYGSECYCSNTYGKYGVSTGCTMPCSGDPTQKCGGGWANNVYRVAAPTTPISIGCYTDTSARDLSFLAQTGSSSMSPSVCNTLCAAYTYFGIQYGNQCYCSNTYGSYGVSTGCTMPCSGDATQKCGGSWANNVYRVAAAPLTPSTSTTWTATFSLSMGTAQLGQLVNDVINAIINDATQAAQDAISVAQSALNLATSAANSASNSLASVNNNVVNAQNNLASKQSVCNGLNQIASQADQAYSSCSGWTKLLCEAEKEGEKLAAEGAAAVCNAALSGLQDVLKGVSAGLSGLQTAANDAKNDLTQASAKLNNAKNALANIPDIHSTALSGLINVYQLSSSFQLSTTMGKITLTLQYSLLGGPTITEQLQVDITVASIKDWFLSLFHPSLYSHWVGSLKRADSTDAPNLIFDGKLSDLCTSFPLTLPVVISDGSSSQYLNQNFPSCLLNASLGGSVGPVTTISLRDGVLAGSLPDLTGKPNLGLLMLSLHGNKIVGSFPQSWAGLTGLRYLDLSSNQGLTGDLSVLGSLSGLTHLDIEDNMMTYQDHPFKLLSNFPNLEFFDLGFTNLTHRFPALGPLVKNQKPTSVRLAIVYGEPLSSYCGSCDISILEGNCAADSCANTSVISATLMSLVNLVDPSLSFTINRVVGWDTESTLFSVTLTSTNAQYDYLSAVQSFNNLNATKDVSYSYAIPGCLPGLSGDKCQFFCPTTWESISLTSYSGGLISRSGSIALPIEILKRMVPSCLVSTGCGSLVDGDPCAVALQNLHDLCADFLNGGTESDVCKTAITKANNVCPQTQCTAAVTNTYILAVNSGLPDWEVAAVVLGAIAATLMLVVVVFLVTRSSRNMERA